ncbi:MAG: DUF6088 family protein [Prevotellaceae bacterium]|jgi:hypothetical protein|nr:DUF6088 family protein [Prevotellaceae bacterium]
MATTITDIVKATIEKSSAGITFTAKDFPVAVVKQKTVNKILNNLVSDGQLRSISKGRFYKPKVTEFGELKPDTYEIVKDLLEKDGKLIGYLTGYSVFNELGLTTQVPFTLQIGAAKDKKSIERGIYKISFVRQANPITKKNIPLLRILDCLRFFKNIPDAMPDDTCRRLLVILQELSDKEKALIKELSLNYTPQATALLGAMLETLNPEEETTAMLHALNPQSYYKLGISENVLLNQKKWNIK